MLTPGKARAELGVASRNGGDVDAARRDLAAANIGAAIREQVSRVDCLHTDDIADLVALLESLPAEVRWRP